MKRTVAQTPLGRMILQNFSRPVDHFLPHGDYDWLILDPPYQRGSVWNLTQRRALIETLLRSLPMGAVVVNKRTDCARYAVVDGRQRIETLRAFCADEFGVPAWWFENVDLPQDADLDADITFSELSLAGQRRLRSRTIATVTARDLSVAEEAHLFVLLNTSGTGQGASTLARARALSAERA